MTLLEPGRTTLRNVLVHDSRGDPLAVKLTLSRLLAAADIRAARLPPSTILVVRHLRDPLPGALQLQNGSARPPPAWERAVAAALDQLARGAARPARDAVPPSAEAVLFADRAELLACLARDWCEGRAATQWWWQSLFKGMDAARAALPAWLDAPEYIPAALQHLAEAGWAVAFACALNVAEARALLRSLTRAFALQALWSVLNEERFDHPAARGDANASRQREGAGNAEASAAPPSSTAAKGVRDAHAGLAAAPWRRWAPEAESRELGLEQCCLLGVGLTVSRAPAVARSTSFARAVSQWRRAVALFGSGEAAMERDDLTPPLAGAAVGENPESATAFDQVRTAQYSTRIGAPVIRAEPQAEGREPSATFDVSDSLNVVERPETDQLLEAQVETGLGGIFYLINLGLFLNLYGDFTTPAEPGLSLPVWDFVALLGQQLVGARIQSDPVWALLARLAGRAPDEAPGQNFDPPDEWRLPREWLTPFTADLSGLRRPVRSWRWSAEDGRLRVQHPEGFWILDVPLEIHDPLQQLAQAVQAYAGIAAFELERGALPDGAGDRSRLDRWLGWLVPYVRARLMRALGLADADDLCRIVFEQRARVHVPAAHLDVVSSLAALPVEIRLAGLDRNPGWVPAAGRFIAFHFE